MLLSELNNKYLFTMVQAMYKYEAKLVWMPELLNDSEMFDFYSCYLGGAPCKPT